jgi:hypothetical protein
MNAALLNYGMYMDDVCVDSIVALFGRRTVKGLSDLILCLQGALIKSKWPVHPESTSYFLKKWWGTIVFKQSAII